jgi:NitT/TauT family transport system substrate-binding protein
MMTKQRTGLSRRWAAALLGGLALSASLAGTAMAAEGQLRIAKQFGVVYLLLNVVEDQKLIETHGKAAGLDIKVEYVQLSGGSAVNDALLSGNIEIAGAGVGPLFTLWDRTKGRQSVKGVASLGNFPYYLVTNNPDVKTIADFSEKDRIALPAVGVSVQSRILQMASAKLWGDKDFARLDKISVAVPHPEAAAAIIKGGTEISGHFGNPPFQDQELAENPKARVVLNSYDVQGGPASSTVLYATENFYKTSPKTYKAFLDALDDAAKFITQNPEKAAEIYLRINGSKIDPALLTKIITNPAVTFKVTPENTLGLGKFMHRVGAIKNEPQAIGDYFFADPRITTGS